MTTLQDKLDNIYQTKLKIKSAIGTDSDVFSEYPALIRNMGGGGVSYSYLDERLSYYVETADLEAMGYVTYTYADSQYISYGYIDDLTYISEYILGPSDPSSPENVYATKYELGSYVSYTYLESKEYATESYVTNAISNIPSVDTSSYVTYSYLDSCGYVTSNDLNNASYATTTDLNNHLPYLGTLQAHYTNSEHFIPKSNNTYYLGNRNFQWQLIYTYNIYSDTTYTSAINFSETSSLTNINAGQITMKLNNNNTFMFHQNFFAPNQANTRTLGTSTLNWLSTYTSYIYTDNAYINASTYLPVNTYWYDGSTYHWLGSLFS